VEAASPSPVRLAKKFILSAFKATLEARSGADPSERAAPAPAPAGKGHAQVDHMARGGEVKYPPKSHLPSAISKEVLSFLHAPYYVSSSCVFSLNDANALLFTTSDLPFHPLLMIQNVRLTDHLPSACTSSGSHYPCPWCTSALPCEASSKAAGIGAQAHQHRSSSSSCPHRSRRACDPWRRPESFENGRTASSTPQRAHCGAPGRAKVAAPRLKL